MSDTSKNIFTKIFKNSSKTFYYSSLFFPEDVQKKLGVLYAFVRIADSFVDQKEQDRVGFYAFCSSYDRAKNDPNFLGYKYLANGDHDKILKSFIQLEKSEQFNHNWTESFLYSMDMDLNKKTYDNMKELTDYMYGSASVIGLYICKILGVSEEYYQYAQTLGTGFQYINFIRDIAEDYNDFGRTYIPNSELSKHGFDNLSYPVTSQYPEKFKQLMVDQIGYFREWQAKGLEGVDALPPKFALAIRTAADCYEWTAKQIIANPFVVYQKKVKPSSLRVVVTGLINMARKK